jgi:hypothetical protein
MLDILPLPVSALAIVRQGGAGVSARRTPGAGGASPLHVARNAGAFPLYLYCLFQEDTYINGLMF